MGTHTEHASRSHRRLSSGRFDDDWHPAEVQAALKMRGLTMKDLSLRHGYNETAVRLALHRRWPAVQAIIAKTLGLEPHEIWPSRYHPDGTPVRLRPWSRQASTRHRRRNVYRGRAA